MAAALGHLDDDLRMVAGRDLADEAIAQAKALLDRIMDEIVRDRAFLGEMGDGLRTVIPADFDPVILLTFDDRDPHCLLALHRGYIGVMNAPATGPVAAEMLRRLEAALSPSNLELIDESEAHRGHGGYNPLGESHFRLEIESAAFNGKSRVERQRLVYAALAELMDQRVHALSIRATAPGES